MNLSSSAEGRNMCVLQLQLMINVTGIYKMISLILRAQDDNINNLKPKDIKNNSG